MENKIYILEEKETKKLIVYKLIDGKFVNVFNETIINNINFELYSNKYIITEEYLQYLINMLNVDFFDKNKNGDNIFYVKNDKNFILNNLKHNKWHFHYNLILTPKYSQEFETIKLVINSLGKLILENIYKQEVKSFTFTNVDIIKEMVTELNLK